ncbi:MAG: c-type cytochrome [Cellvibrio sp.]|uniref:c-type cytochrome n=1 Tax=Cellvibrio sp. TaxID=1965322 RepID=UPI0031ADEE1A
MRSLLIRLCLLVCYFLSVSSALAEEPDYSLLDSASVDNGKIASADERCQECHGADGNIHANNESGKIPKLAGQHPAYLLKQFTDFRSGNRHNDFMAMMARTVDDETAADIFAYYAAQPIMKGDGAGSNALGKKLYLEGDAARQIQACSSCHGVSGKGVASDQPSPIAGLPVELIPVIGGQDWHYLDQQLRDWRDGERTNSTDGVMNKVTAKLTDNEIKALNDYISSL